MQYLPEPEQQSWLLAELATLIGRRGFATFVAAPLLEPRPEHFPDRWRPDAIGVRRLARRLLSYADLGGLDVEVELYQNDIDIERIDARGRATSFSHQGAAAWFAGIEDGTCLFGADVRQLSTPDSFAGTMAHEVAHAYRRRHRLEVSDHDREEKLTDLTTVYLGFGLLTTNSAYRYRQSGDVNGRSATLEWSHQRGGYLSPQAMSFLLAAQVTARGGAAGERRRIAGMLETNQAAYFKAACEALAGQDVAMRLGLPARTVWPAPRAPQPAPLADADGDDADADADAEDEAIPPRDPAAEEIAAIRGRNRGLAIFRVRAHAAGLFTAGFVIVAAVVGIFLMVRRTIEPTGWMAMMALAAAVGWWVGRRREWDSCSEPDCTAVLPADAQTCSGCGGTIRGRIRVRDERLEAREALEQDARRHLVVVRED